MLPSLRRPGGEALPPWVPGVHIDLLGEGVNQRYSRCGDSRTAGPKPPACGRTVSLVRTYGGDRAAVH